MHMARERALDGAILDINLNGRPCFQVCAILSARRTSLLPACGNSNRIPVGCFDRQALRAYRDERCPGADAEPSAGRAATEGLIHRSPLTSRACHAPPVGYPNSLRWQCCPRRTGQAGSILAKRQSNVPARRPEAKARTARPPVLLVSWWEPPHCWRRARPCRFGAAGRCRG
jgi:hypothetical protein